MGPMGFFLETEQGIADAARHCVDTLMRAGLPVDREHLMGELAKIDVTIADEQLDDALETFETKALEYHKTKQEIAAAAGGAS